jgi:hypothetical protein
VPYNFWFSSSQFYGTTPQNEKAARSSGDQVNIMGFDRNQQHLFAQSITRCKTVIQSNTSQYLKTNGGQALAFWGEARIGHECLEPDPHPFGSWFFLLFCAFSCIRSPLLQSIRGPCPASAESPIFPTVMLHFPDSPYPMSRLSRFRDPSRSSFPWSHEVDGVNKGCRHCLCLTQ